MQLKELGGRQEVVKLKFFRQKPYASPCTYIPRCATEYLRSATSWTDVSEQYHYGRGLTSAVWSEQTKDLADRDSEIEITDGGKPTVILAEAIRFNRVNQIDSTSQVLRFRRLRRVGTQYPHHRTRPPDLTSPHDVRLERIDTVGSDGREQEDKVNRVPGILPVNTK